MPLYEYKCLSCGKKFEVLQKFSDAPVAVHADCGGPAERLISPPAFHFKGSGWYVTDYARSNGSSQEGKSESKSAESKSGESKSGESKSGESKSEGAKKSESGAPAKTETKTTAPAGATPDSK